MVFSKLSYRGIIKTINHAGKKLPKNVKSQFKEVALSTEKEIDIL